MATANRPALLAIGAVLALGACGGASKAATLAHAQQALDTALTATTHARDGFVAWDSTQQQRIVEEATSLEDGKAALATHRNSRDEVASGFAAAYSAIALAATALALYAAGSVSTADAVAAIAKAAEAVQAVHVAYYNLARGADHAE